MTRQVRAIAAALVGGTMACAVACGGEVTRALALVPVEALRPVAALSLAAPGKAGARAMMRGPGGSLLVQGNSSWSAPGHNAVIAYDNRTYNVYHALAAPSGQNGTATLRISEIVWDANGWPISGGP